jgi:hypothetical protein
MSSLVSQENKELLWSLLAEEGLFDGIPDNVTPEEIKLVFERILKNLSATIPSLHAAKLKELHHAKRHAIAEEDYDTAKKIRTTIDEMEAPLARLEKLEARKALAIQAEDYEAAKQIKMEIDRIRAASFSLKELNKIAIESLVVNIPKLARDISALKTQGTAPPPPPPPHRGVFPHNNMNASAHQYHGRDVTPKEIYNAEDFQNQKRQEIEMKMREKEAEMRSYFEVPRPKEIDFSDIPRDARPVMRLKAAPGNTDVADIGDDSPIAADGDDMEKLIAERIAARQRDLDEIGERMKASMPPEHTRAPVTPAEYNPNDVSPVDASPTPMPPPALQSVDTRKVHEDIRRVPEDIRRVRFQEEDTNPIFLKLKRKPMVED